MAVFKHPVWKASLGLASGFFGAFLVLFLFGVSGFVLYLFYER